jgi:hypothetical protein
MSRDVIRSTTMCIEAVGTQRTAIATRQSGLEDKVGRDRHVSKPRLRSHHLQLSPNDGQVLSSGVSRHGCLCRMVRLPRFATEFVANGMRRMQCCGANTISNSLLLLYILYYTIQYSHSRHAFVWLVYSGRFVQWTVAASLTTGTSSLAAPLACADLRMGMVRMLGFSTGAGGSTLGTEMVKAPSSLNSADK